MKWVKILQRRNYVRWLLSKSLPFLFLILSSREALCQQQSQELLQEWSSSSQWQKLLHFRKDFLQSPHSIVQGPLFFLAPNGKNDAWAEMQATYQAMFKADPETQKKIQCQFMARREFFKSRLDLEKHKIWPCPEREAWLKELNAQKISLIFATGYLSAAGSSFGHTFLKLKNPENQGQKEILNYAINFAARTEDTSGALYALYGLFGYFPGTFGMLPFYQMTKEYTHLEGRDLWEYELNLTADEVRLFLYHVIELEGSYFDYYFLDDNCSYALLKILEVARPGLELAKDDEAFVIPLDSAKNIQNIVTKRTYLPSLQTIWKAQYQKLNSEQIQIIKDEKWASADLQTLEAAQDYLGRRLFEETLKWRDANFNLSKERAKRGQGENFRDEILKELDSKALPPEEAPDSARFSLGYLDNGQRNFIFGFHLAFHDQLSRNQGATPFSHLQLISFDFQSPDSQNLFLNRYRFLEILSTSAVDRFDRPLSWGVSLGGNSIPQVPTRIQNHILGEFGYSFDLIADKVRLSPLLKLGARQNESEVLQPTFGTNTRIWILWTAAVRSLINYEDLQMQNLRQQSFQLQQAIDLNQQLELRIAWKQSRFNDRQETEKLINLWQNFLF